MDGIETLAAIRQIQPRLPVIILNVPTAQGAAATLGALIHGATDFVMKPGGERAVRHGAEGRSLDELVAKVALWCPVGVHRPLLVAATPAVPSRREGGGLTAPRVDVLAIGTSTGGPGALMDLIPRLPADFPVPILIVQHMPPVFTKLLADRLDATSSIAVAEGGMAVSRVAGTCVDCPRRLPYGGQARRRHGRAIVTQRNAAGEFLPAGGRRPVSLGGQRLRPARAGRGHDRDGTGRLARMPADSGGGRADPRPGRSQLGRLGHARVRRPRRPGRSGRAVERAGRRDHRARDAPPPAGAWPPYERRRS